MTSPQWIEARWQHARLAQLTLGSAGEPIHNRHALAIQADHTTPPAPPYPEGVVAAVLRAERAARTSKQRRGAERNPPERVTRRVSMINDHPVAVHLLVAVLATGGANAAAPRHDHLAGHEPLHRPAERVRQASRGHQVRRARGPAAGGGEGAWPLRLAAGGDRAVGRREAPRDGGSRRATVQHRGLFELLTLLEYHAVDTGAAHQRTEDRETVVRYAWRCCEYILRRVVRDNPVELPRRSRRLRQLPERQRALAEKTEFQHLLATAATRLGLNYGDAREIDMVERSAPQSPPCLMVGAAADR